MAEGSKCSTKDCGHFFAHGEVYYTMADGSVNTCFDCSKKRGLVTFKEKERIVHRKNATPSDVAYEIVFNPKTTTMRNFLKAILPKVNEEEMIYILSTPMCRRFLELLEVQMGLLRLREEELVEISEKIVTMTESIKALGNQNEIIIKNFETNNTEKMEYINTGGEKVKL
jgi:hypothetical protein